MITGTMAETPQARRVLVGAGSSLLFTHFCLIIQQDSDPQLGTSEVKVDLGICCGRLCPNAIDRW